MATLIASCRKTTWPASHRRMDVCHLSPLPLPSSARVPHIHIKTDHASPIGLNLTQQHNENNRPLVTRTTPPKQLQPEDPAFSKLAISPEIQVSSSLLEDLLDGLRRFAVSSADSCSHLYRGYHSWPAKDYIRLISNRR